LVKKVGPKGKKGKRVKGEKGKTMRESDFLNFFAVSPFRLFPPNLFPFQAGGG
jgi:hypothetical protein